MQQYATIKRALRIPSQASPEAKDLFRAVLKLPTIRDAELADLRDNYEGDHTVLIDRFLRKPPSWDDTTWAYIREGLMAINSTRTSLRALSAVYSGVQFRKVSSTSGPFADQVAKYVSSPGWRSAMKRVMRESALYGTAYFAPFYDRQKRRLGVRHLNPVTTHVLVREIDPETPIAIAEFDEKRNWVRIWTSSFSATLARKEEDVEYTDYLDENEEQVDRPYFPIVIAKAEEVPGSPYGLSMLRDTPRFNRSLSVSYFNVSYSALLKAQALLTITTGDNTGEETGADLTQLGPHAALLLPQGSSADFKSNGADLNALLEVIDRLQDLESYILGIPTIKTHKNLSASGAELAAFPLTNQIGELALTMSSVETAGIHLLLMVGHWEVGSPLTPEDSERLYQVAVRISPTINVASLQERVQSKTMLSDKGAIPEEEVVAEFAPHLSYPEVEAQAEIMRERNQVSKSSAAA